MAQVTLSNIKKVYPNGYVAVHDASIQINDGEFVVLVGPSGCGKSTTLRMVAGLESISSGELKIGDRLVNDVAPKDRDIAMVFQNYALYPHMTVFENMAFGLKLRKYPKAEIEDRVRNAAVTLGIDQVLDRKPKELSGGQRQRVAVGRAIVRKPQVFLFDEPLSNLDAKLRVQMRTEISRLHRKLGATMVYVTHDQVEAMTMGDRIVVLKDGYIQQIDTPMNLYDRPVNKFVAGFIGSPAMNFVAGELIQEEGLAFHSDAQHLTIPISSEAHPHLADAAGKKVLLGVRPEDIYIDQHIPSDVNTSPFGEVTLDVLEPMGNEIFVYASVPGYNLVARVAPQALPPVGASVNISCDVSKLHFFDAETEASLSPSDSVAEAA